MKSSTEKEICSAFLLYPALPSGRLGLKGVHCCVVIVPIQSAQFPFVADLTHCKCIILLNQRNTKLCVESLEELLVCQQKRRRVPATILLKTYVYFLHLPREPFACQTKQYSKPRDPLHALEGTCSLLRLG